jgi:hypothetical protein
LELLPEGLAHKGRGGEPDEDIIQRFGCPVATAIGRWRKE